jgi:predicted unusual protein kinase regulating ubiquinone biosynthesis (AarF/ABC1/UbiB family)
MVDKERKVPQGRLGRLARFATVGVRTGAGLLLDRGGDATAKHAAEVLGTLRGLAAKVGQMASYIDGVVPEAQRDAYESAMKVLFAAAPRSSPEQVRARVEEELGAPIDRLFARWVDEPLASASIGQVHVAELHDGREVAVKVQHPGITRAVESDLANAGFLESVARAMGWDRLDPKRILAVIRQRFREELDYRLEAERISRFADLHAADPHIRVPSLVGSHSTQCVLTTELARGATFDEACSSPPEDRRAWARSMWRFVFKGTMVGGMLNADPHPGNYVFHPEGRVTFLDYGCVQELDPRHQRLARAVHLAALARDENAFHRAVATLVGAKPGPLEEMSVAYTRRCFKPLFESPYHITRGYAASLVGGMRDMGRLALTVKEHEHFAMPPDMVFINRLQFGFYSVLARMDVEVDYASVERGFLLPVNGAPGV